MKAADCWGQAMESPGTGAGGGLASFFAETRNAEMQMAR